VPIYPGINHIKPGSLLLPLPICDTLIKGGKGAIFNERLLQKSKLLADGAFWLVFLVWSVRSLLIVTWVL
jgi:hypothetical protein